MTNENHNAEILAVLAHLNGLITSLCVDESRLPEPAEQERIDGQLRRLTYMRGDLEDMLAGKKV